MFHFRLKSDKKPNGAKVSAGKHLQYINRQGSYSDQSLAASHVEYINREKAFANRGDCLFHAHHLPKWAHDDPKKFFQAADEYEAADNRRYREIEFALPNELKTVEQYRQIINAFIAKHLQDHYYAYAIHDKIGVMSEGQHHPHVHIMFSERFIDDVEKAKERTPDNFFKYPARRKKDGSEPSFEERWNRGAPKNRKWASKDYLKELRADFALIQNDVLEKNGFSIRVDHRSLKAQKEEAERNGDTFLTRLFNRIPEEYVGVISCHEDDEPKIERLRKFRQLRKQHFDLLTKLDALTKETDELESKDAAQESETRAKKLIDTYECVSQYQQELKTKMLTAVAEVNKWKRIIISHHDALTQAKLEYMTKAERELWQKYFETLAQKKRLEEFLATLHKPKEFQKLATKAYEDILVGVHAKIKSLSAASLAMKSDVEKIEQRLEEPDFKKNVLLITHQILQANTHARRMLRQASADLDKAIAELSDTLVDKKIEEPQNIFKTHEVYDLIRRQFFVLKKEHGKNLDLKFELQRQVISTQRALAMAKNIFVRGEYKRLHEALRRQQKDSQRLAKKLIAYSQQEKNFKQTDWKVLPKATFLQQQYYLTKQRTLLEMEKSRLDQLKISLQTKQAELDARCQVPESQQKIEKIAAGILRKNFKHVRRLEEVEARDKELAQRMAHAKEQMLTLKELLSREKTSTHYKVVSHDVPPKEQAASLIANAILLEPQAVQLVVRSIGNNLEMEKNWELMSELDKDELIRKKIVREL